MDSNINSRLEQARTDLLHWYEQLNRKLQEAEQRAASMQVGTPVFVHLETEVHEGPPTKIGTVTVDDGSIDVDLWLGFLKHGGEWRLCIGSGYDVLPMEIDHWTPVLECSREVRVRAAKKTPELFENLIVEAEKATSSMEEASAVLSELLALFPAKRPDTGPVR